MKKILISITFLAFTSCASNQLKTYDSAVIEATSTCTQKLDNKEYSKKSEMLEKCQMPQMLSIYETFYGRDNLDLMIAIENKKLELTKKLESNKIKQAEFDKVISDFEKKQLKISEIRREKAIKKQLEIDKKIETERKKEAERIAKYYREHPEILIAEQQLELQRQQVQALQQQNMIAAQQMRSNQYMQQQQINIQQQQLLQNNYPQQRFQTNCRSYVRGQYLNTDCN